VHDAAAGLIDLAWITGATDRASDRPKLRGELVFMNTSFGISAIRRVR
jgi:hypothetical protein